MPHGRLSTGKNGKHYRNSFKWQPGSRLYFCPELTTNCIKMNENNALKAFVLLFFTAVFIPANGFSQQQDSTQKVTTFSGTIGFTNNGFSIVPTFSLNHSAFILNFYLRKKKFSFDPDIRLTPDAKKGSMLWWLRYYPIEKKKFILRLGVHPAFTLIRKTVNDNGTDLEITEMLRFAAVEVAPSYKITRNWSVEAIYLHGSALQNHGPQNTDVVFLNTAISNIKLGRNLKGVLVPMFFYLMTDGHDGSYFSATGVVEHTKWPFSLKSTINQTITSNIPNNRNFMWNVSLNYRFQKQFVAKK